MNFKTTCLFISCLITYSLSSSLPSLDDLKKMTKSNLKAFMSDGKLLEMWNAYPSDKMWEFFNERGEDFLKSYNIKDILHLESSALLKILTEGRINFELLSEVKGWENITFNDIEVSFGKNTSFDLGRLPWYKMDPVILDSLYQKLPIEAPLEVTYRIFRNSWVSSNDHYFTPELAEYIKSSNSKLWMVFCPSKPIILKGQYGKFMKLIYNNDSFTDSEKFLRNSLSLKDPDLELLFESLDISDFMKFLKELPDFARHSVINRMNSISPLV